MEKLLKNVDPENWRELKLEAHRHHLKLGEFMGYLLKEHQRREKKKPTAWDYVLSRRKRLSDSEAESMKKSLAVFEKEYEFEA